MYPGSTVEDAVVIRFAGEGKIESPLLSGVLGGCRVFFFFRWFNGLYSVWSQKPTTCSVHCPQISYSTVKSKILKRWTTHLLCEVSKISAPIYFLSKVFKPALHLEICTEYPAYWKIGHFQEISLIFPMKKQSMIGSLWRRKRSYVVLQFGHRYATVSGVSSIIPKMCLVIHGCWLDYASASKFPSPRFKINNEGQAIQHIGITPNTIQP